MKSSEQEEPQQSEAHYEIRMDSKGDEEIHIPYWSESPSSAVHAQN